MVVVVVVVVVVAVEVLLVAVAAVVPAAADQHLNTQCTIFDFVVLYRMISRFAH